MKIFFPSFKCCFAILVFAVLLSFQSAVIADPYMFGLYDIDAMQNEGVESYLSLNDPNPNDNIPNDTHDLNHDLWRWDFDRVN